MAENNTPNKQLKLKIVTPAGTALEVFCRSVRLNLPCSDDGNSGGMIGIRPGHLPAMISLGSGNVTAFDGTAKIAEKHIGGGFATVADDVVTVLTTET